MSTVVHRSPSSQGVPLAFGGLEQAPVARLHVPATWQPSCAVQVTGAAPKQNPSLHVSIWVHRSPSSHGVPSIAGGFVHSPVAESHVPATWHASCAVHTTGPPARQAPATHVSPCVHRLPSLHAVPSARVGFEHVPVPGLHTPATWHWSWAVQSSGSPPTHIPATQVSCRVQKLPSSHGVLFGRGGLVHTPVAELHVPAMWHESSAVHVSGSAPTHAPPRQMSVRVQRLLSLHAVPSAAAGLLHSPVAGLHAPATWH